MSKTTKLDPRRRGTFPPPFRPGDVFTREVAGNTVTFHLIQPAEVPLVKSRRISGKLMSPAKVDDKLLSAAIRHDRDSR